MGLTGRGSTHGRSLRPDETRSHGEADQLSTYAQILLEPPEHDPGVLLSLK